ncbi:hypothetical protein [Vallicoccus soli]|uniref:hypothetical protein n=1 Tax=Vallicoccus soli TaxID=2339232 RepID=UPI0014041C51|nr:hypothetical protein [Vallicoccus soli]
MQLHPDTPDPVLARLRTARWRVVAGLALGLAAGAALHQAQDPVYRSTVAVELGEVAPAVDLSPTAQQPRLLSIDTDAQLVRSDAVVGAVADVVDRPAAEVRTDLRVGARQLTRVLEITYADGTARDALAGVRVATEAYLAERERLVVEPARAYLRGIGEATDDPVRAPDGAAPDADAGADADADAAGTDASVEASAGDVSGAAESEARRERALRLELALPAAGRVLQAADPAPAPERPDVEVPLASGAAVGALLGLGSTALVPARPRRRRPGVAS